MQSAPTPDSSTATTRAPVAKASAAGKMTVTVDDNNSDADTFAVRDLLVATNAANQNWAINDGSTAGKIIVYDDIIFDLGGSGNATFNVGLFDPRVATLQLNFPNGAPSEDAYLLASGTVAGPFAIVLGLPAGYRLDYAYDDGLSSINIPAPRPGQHRPHPRFHRSCSGDPRPGPRRHCHFRSHLQRGRLRSRSRRLRDLFSRCHRSAHIPGDCPATSTNARRFLRIGIEQIE